MENNRPTMRDPEEFALIKSIYFKDNRPINEDLDPKEKLDRIEAKQRFNQKSSR